MALQQAITAITTSDAANIETRDILNSLVMGVIDAAISTQSSKTDTDERIYKVTLTFPATITSTTGVVEVIQSDLTKVFLSDIEGALTDALYRTSVRAIKSSRVGIDDKVKLQIAWGAV